MRFVFLTVYATVDHPFLCCLDIGLNEAGHRTIDALVTLLSPATVEEVDEEIKKKEEDEEEKKKKDTNKSAKEIEEEEEEKKKAKGPKQENIKKMVGKEHKLIELKLDYNMIGSQIQLLLAAMVNDTKLLKLDVSYNSTGDSIVKMACHMIRYNSTLISFNMLGNHISTPWSKNFAEAAKKNNMLKELKISQKHHDWKHVEQNLPRIKAIHDNLLHGKKGGGFGRRQSISVGRIGMKKIAKKKESDSCTIT